MIFLLFSCLSLLLLLLLLLLQLLFLLLLLLLLLVLPLFPSLSYTITVLASPKVCGLATENLMLYVKLFKLFKY
jgi:hypothetical protein